MKIFHYAGQVLLSEVHLIITHYYYSSISMWRYLFEVHMKIYLYVHTNYQSLCAYHLSGRTFHSLCADVSLNICVGNLILNSLFLMRENESEYPALE